MSLIKKSIDASTANKAIVAAMAKAAEIGIKISVTITDEAGTVKALVRDDGAMPITLEVSTNKAYTAAAGGLPTHMWYDVIKDDAPLLHGLVHTDRIVVFGGGFPITEDGAIIGAIGVSGGHYSQDMECATAGLTALGL